MVLTERMRMIIETVRVTDEGILPTVFDETDNQIGNVLIALYYQTNNSHTRELINQFMTEAGPVWLRKLLTRDLCSIESSDTPFASIHDYVNLLASDNDSDKEGVDRHS